MISNPRDDKTQNEGTVNASPLEGPKRIILRKHIEKPKSPLTSETRKWVYASGGYLRSPKTAEIAPCKGKPCLIPNFSIFWPSVWYHIIEIFHTNFSMRVYLA